MGAGSRIMESKSSPFIAGPKNESEPDVNKQKMRLQLEMKRRNIESVLLYSNVTPFIWHRGKHMCFYCQVAHKQPNQILTHYDEHDCVDLPTAVKRYTQKRGNREAAIKVEITDLYCKLCSENMANLDELIQHLIENHDVDYDLSIPNCFLPFRLTGVPTCGTCNMEFDLFEYLLRHANKQHMQHSFICEICGKSSFSERYHVLHVRSFHQEGGYRCEYCGLKLSSLRKKTLHVQNVHKENQFKCTICDETLKSSYFKNVHLAEVHGVEEKRIKCPHCPRVFPQDNIMIRHMRRVHLKLKEHMCPVCGIRFFESYQMKNHLMYHTGENNFSCEICGKTFLRKHYLTKHLNSHKISGKFKEEGYDSETYELQTTEA